ncbi:uncharacterized protein J7T55_013813 [Diaporthe amygdali]|uniref:uncharacterized protein n=1 Tax=Phomopsis amygdali TaxID=1214568 RepID=UPI0022FEC613|nr:uncharacterized protein J7T55_013813 [Diaporthe amygdali]KAJ0119610.1 uncharacterized protein J7T55_013813 [Diaporthe amygdali]
MSSEPATDTRPQRLPHAADIMATWRRFAETYNNNRFKIENRWINMDRTKKIQLVSRAWPTSGNYPGDLSIVVGDRGYYDGKAMTGLYSAGDDEDDAYGALYYVTPESDIEALHASGLDHGFQGAVLMEIQIRIYGFLENLATEIIAGRNDTLYSCPGEDIQRIWKPTAPARGIAQQPGDETNLEQYLSIHRDTFLYTCPSESMWEFLIAICGSRMQAFENKIQGLKEDPGKFLEYLTDVRDHSHHMVLYTDGSSYPWASEESNNNLRMWSTYFKAAMADLTVACDTWHNMYDRALRLSEAVPGTEDWTTHLLTLQEFVAHRLFLFYPVTDALTSSKVLRRYFRNRSTVDNHIPQFRAFADELLNLIRRGQPWMTDYATEKAEEAFDCTMVDMITQRSFKSQSISIEHAELQDFGAWNDYMANLENMDQMHSSIILCMKKHLTPDPMTQFSYPAPNSKLKGVKLTEWSTARKTAETNLERFWADMEPLLKDEDALSPYVISLLDNASPNSTVQDDPGTTSPPPLGGLSITGEPSPVAGTSGTSGPARPGAMLGIGGSSPPPGLAGPPGTPPAPSATRDLQSAPKTPEKKTTNDARQPVFNPPPPADVPPEQARPRIVLDAENYETARLLMTTSTENRPGQIAWEDVLNFFRATLLESKNLLRLPFRDRHWHMWDLNPAVHAVIAEGCKCFNHLLRSGNHKVSTNHAQKIGLIEVN